MGREVKEQKRMIFLALKKATCFKVGSVSNPPQFLHSLQHINQSWEFPGLSMLLLLRLQITLAQGEGRGPLLPQNLFKFQPKKKQVGTFTDVP